MPNWAQNVVTFKHGDPAMIQRVVQAYENERLMQEFHPCPVELMDERSTTYGGPDKEQQDALRASNLERFGHANWYDWRVANWGTKWDIGDGGSEVAADGLSVRFSFDSAWSPPIQFYEKMEELGFTIDAFYYEPGMSFCGRYTDGSDGYIEIKGNSDWVDANVPSEINEMFAVSETMSMWEEEDADERRVQEELDELAERNEKVEPEVFIHTNDGYNGLGFNGTARQALEAVRALRPMIDQQEPGETPNWLSDFVSTLEGLCQEAGVMDENFNPTGE